MIRHSGDIPCGLAYLGPEGSFSHQAAELAMPYVKSHMESLGYDVSVVNLVPYPSNSAIETFIGLGDAEHDWPTVGVVPVETRVEETGRILQKRALGEGKLHDILVGFASADDAVVRPNRSAHPLPLLDDVRVCFLDELAHSAEGFPAPVPEFGDSFRDELRCRLALARARLFHVLILEVPDIFHLQDSGDQPVSFGPSVMSVYAAIWVWLF
jgi:hypothetical protein